MAQTLDAAQKPTHEELMERIAAREPVELDEPSEVTIRRIRDLV